MLSEQDVNQLKAHGIKKETVDKQLKNFQEGFPFIDIVKAATVNDGVLQVSDELIDQYISEYDQDSPKFKVTKFVPASGAASRMFKALFSFVDSYKGTDEDYQKMISDKEYAPIVHFFKRINEFAFYDDLKKTHETKGKGLNEAILQRDYVPVLQSLLSEDALNYGSLPKGLLKFHRYSSESRTPVEEHLVEGAKYCKSADNKVYLHFTVSPEHREKFIELIDAVKPAYEEKYGVTYEISFSEQKPSTDMIAVDMENQPFRNGDGSILFRPGGHGALIENLNDLDTDVVFIKNIDNVVPDRLKGDTYRYKKLLGGLLLSYQKTIFEYLNFLDTAEEITSDQVEEIRHFVENQLCVLSPKVFSSMQDDEKISWLISKLDRPIRVCGMVKNEGEPGGGPYWVSSSDGTTSLQIVESAQVNMDDPDQARLFKEATHFNPVDIVGSLKDHKGKKFDLHRYVDPSTGFITKKSKDGRDLKAQELPGLWNGSMAEWTTIFVEVPVITFNPVKTVNDLLREQHQEG